MREELAEEIQKMLEDVRQQLIGSQKLMIQSIIGLCSIALAHLHNQDIDKAKDSLVSLMTQLESRSEDA